MHEGPLALRSDWLAHVNAPQTEAELEPLRRCAERGAPFEDAALVAPTAARRELEHTLRPRGRPGKRKSAGTPDAAEFLFREPAGE